MDYNHLALLVAAAAQFVVGMLWYSPIMFAKEWMEEVGLKKADMDKAQKKGMGGKMVISLVTSLVLSYGLSFIYSSLGLENDLTGALRLALVLWLTLNATVHVGSTMWEGKSVRYYLINASYWLVSFLVMTAIIVAWQ